MKVMLSIYVDDFKMSGPKRALKEAWGKLSKKINLEPPTPIGRYLGCNHAIRKGRLRKDIAPWLKIPHISSDGGANPPTDREITIVEYDMTSFLEQCLESYQELCGANFSKYKKAPTPFINDDTHWDEGAKNRNTCTHRFESFDEGFVCCANGAARFASCYLCACS